MHKNPWRLIVEPAQAAAENMAIDEAIAIAFSEGKAPETLRLYTWKNPSFSIGAFQMLEKDWITFLEAQEIDIVRRMTGGRGLLHEHELSYSVIASIKDPLFSGGIKGTFESIARGLLAGLKEIGVAAILHTSARKPHPKAKKALCFDAVSGYEITAQGKKLIGSAQRRWKTHFLQHGSFVIKQSEWVKNEKRAFPLKLISENQITLTELMASPPNPETLIHAIKTGFEKTFDLNLEVGELSDDEKKLAQGCLQEKYARRTWNLYREKR
ncbi:Lipoate-protein ligase A [hydrothermal vent metagenome]|uniref:Lipoate-protein ligase A n=1 Tax=hydrothermal vent metagenome TaxID=652676 RepID=A0A3B1CXX1_9ZZZZ